ncbi:MAG: WG repeat-containing protein [Pilosibacter sp.]
MQYAGKWGYINQYGNMVINAEYSEALPFLNGKAFAYDDQGNIEVLELKYFELF